jgi:SAM-dependent methyltransferase
MTTHILNAVLKRWGGTSTKQRIWDDEYRSGKWNHLDPSARVEVQRDLIYEALDRYSQGASILDLGCGTASTAIELKSDYASYLGVDISEIAIAQARQAVDRHSRLRHKARFAVSDILRFLPEGEFGVILFRECLYYFPRFEVKAVLEHYAGFLGTSGVFVARFHDRIKYEPLVSMIARDYEVVERLAPEFATEIVLVFQPRNLSSKKEQA